MNGLENVLTPELVVEETAPQDHPLHNLFGWDDAEAHTKVEEV